MEEINNIELGEKIYEACQQNKKKKIAIILKEMNVKEYDGRIAYWSYVIFMKLKVKEILEQRQEEHKINNFRNYIVIYFSKFLKMFNIEELDDNVKTELANFFISLLNMKDKDVLDKIDNKFQELFIENIETKKKLLEAKDKIDNLKNEQVEIVKENIEIKDKQKDISSIKEIIKKSNDLAQAIKIISILIIALLIFISISK